MLAEGASPQQVLAAITDPELEPDFSMQQYGVVALGFEDEPATYTGAGTPGWKGTYVGTGCLYKGTF